MNRSNGKTNLSPNNRVIDLASAAAGHSSVCAGLCGYPCPDTKTQSALQEHTDNEKWRQGEILRTTACRALRASDEDPTRPHPPTVSISSGKVLSRQMVNCLSQGPQMHCSGRRNTFSLRDVVLPPDTLGMEHLEGTAKCLGADF